MLSHLRALLTHVSAPVLIVGAALSAYSGAAFAVTIFSTLEPGVIAWLRVFIGMKWAFFTAAAWAIYILLGQRVASKRSGVTNLAVGCALSGLIVAPFVLHQAFPAITQPRILGIVIVVAVLSTVVPCSFEAIAMHRVSAAAFSLFTALSPASSLLVGVIILRQIPTLWQMIGLLLISFAVAIASRHGTKDHAVLAEEVHEMVELAP